MANLLSNISTKN